MVSPFRGHISHQLSPYTSTLQQSNPNAYMHHSTLPNLTNSNPPQNQPQPSPNPTTHSQSKPKYQLQKELRRCVGDSVCVNFIGFLYDKRVPTILTFDCNHPLYLYTFLFVHQLSSLAPPPLVPARYQTHPNAGQHACKQNQVWLPPFPVPDPQGDF